MTVTPNMDATGLATGRAAAAPPALRPRPRRVSRGTLTLVLLVATSIVLLILINAYPLADAAFQTVHNGTLSSQGSYVGFGNYRSTLTSPAFWKAVEFTMIFTIVGVFGSWAVGMGLALLLRTRIPARAVFKTLLLLPWVV